MNVMDELERIRFKQCHIVFLNGIKKIMKNLNQASWSPSLRYEFYTLLGRQYECHSLKCNTW